MENITHRNQPATATVAGVNNIQPVDPVSRSHPATATMTGVNVEPKERVSANIIHEEPKNPTIGQWAKWHWLDILTMGIMGAIGLGVYFVPPAPSRSFPIYNLDGNIAYPEHAYPLRKEIFPIWAAAVLACLAPMFVFFLMQFRVRSFWDFNNAIFGLLYALITAAVFQVFIKWLIGGLRPHFLAVCMPDITNQKGRGFGDIMFDRKVCTNPNKRAVNDALESFPSGHATAAFAGFVFLYLYLNAKFKVFSDYRPAYWKLVVLYMPILGAVLVAGALTIDEYHHWWDIIAGALIGTMMALSAYRMVYASIWNYRYNHIPLYPDAPQAPFTGDPASRAPTWTRKAGWGLGSSVPLSRGPNSSANGVYAV